MATISGPLMSLEAAGQFGHTIIYERFGGKTYAKNYKAPTNNRFPAQVGIRAMNYFITKLWADLDQASKDSWIPLAEQNKYSPANAYFAFNMNRWTQNEAPTTVNEEIDPDPYTNSITLVATPSDGECEITITKTITPAHRTVTTSGAAPSPDCRGTYNVVGTYNGENYYQRTGAAPNYQLYKSVGPRRYIDTNRPHVAGTACWYKDNTTSGTYAGAIGYTGSPIVSDEIAEVTAAPCNAVAIYRSPTTIVTPTRQICRAVLLLDQYGEVTWTDTDQVGGKAGPTGGLAAGDYHYMAVGLSLYGRAGPPTADIPATVT